MCHIMSSVVAFEDLLALNHVSSFVISYVASILAYQVGTEGEYLGLDNVNHANSSVWSSGNLLPTNQSLIWYKVCVCVMLIIEV